jgi:hypothetical protein
MTAVNEIISNSTIESLQFIPGQITQQTNDIATTINGLVTSSAEQVLATTLTLSDSTLRSVDLESERIRNVIMNMKF